MLVGLKQPLKQRNSYPVTLDFMKAGKVTIDVQVAAIGARAPEAGANHTHGMIMPGMNHH
jgi:copper(I)-binding protein